MNLQSVEMTKGSKGRKFGEREEKAATNTRSNANHNYAETMCYDSVETKLIPRKALRAVGDFVGRKMK